MEISYRREMKRNYLVVEPENKEAAGYEARMLEENHIQGLLKMRIKYQEGQPLYYYDITSRQPLSRLLEKRFITKNEICTILMQLHSTLTRMEAFLLREEGILLEPDYIYMEPELFRLGVCLAPENEGDFQDQLSHFLQYILKRVDHKDRECVVLAYGLYQESLKENVTMEDLLRLTAAEGMKESYAAGDWDAAVDNQKEEGESREYCGSGSLVQPPGMAADLSDSAVDIQKPCLPFKKQLLLWLPVVLFLPAFIWAMKGKEALLEFRYILLAIDIGLLSLLMLGDVLMVKFGLMQGKEEKLCVLEEERKDSSWKILYEDVDESPPAPASHMYIQHIENEPKSWGSPERGPVPEHQLNKTTEETFQTALLSEPSYSSPLCRLTALQPGGEDILIGYYPFVIGKNKELADYVLSKDTVSRFHLRIDKEEERYLVTDLNSTNGTRVNNYSLEANETVEIKPGDEIYIAEIGYVFF